MLGALPLALTPARCTKLGRNAPELDTKNKTKQSMHNSLVQGESQDNCNTDSAAPPSTANVARESFTLRIAGVQCLTMLVPTALKL